MGDSQEEKSPASALEALRERLEQDGVSASRELLARVEPADIAALLAELDAAEQVELFRKLEVEVQAEVLGELERRDVRSLADGAAKSLKAALRKMEPDEAVDVLGALTTKHAESLLEELPPDQAAAADILLKYPPDSAGGLMTTRFVLLDEGITAREAIEITQHSRETETVAHLFVADGDKRLLGHLSLDRVVFAAPNRPIAELLEDCPLRVRPETDQEELVRAATRYDLHVIPVTDEQGRMIGVVTVDDILEAAEHETDEDMYRMAGTGERDPVHASAARSARLRLPWLLLSVFDGLLMAFLVSRFTDALKTQELIFFIPLIPLMGGQVAIQGSTIVVRALALNTLPRTRMLPFLKKQLLITLLLAACCSLATGVLGTLLVGAHFQIMLAVSLAVAVAIVFAGMLGMIFPFIFNAIGIDPAVSSGPFITMLSDFFCVGIYLTLGAMLASPV